MRLRFFAPDTDMGNGGTEQAQTDAEQPETTEQQQPAEQPETGETEQEEEDDDVGLSPEQLNSELERVRKQAAKYRVERREAREKLAAAQARITELETNATPTVDTSEQRIAAAERRAAIAEAAAEHGIPMAAINAFRSLEAAEGDQIQAALEALKQFLAGQPVGGQRPPDGTTSAPTLDQQIAEAEAKGDVKTSMRLKSAKFAQARQK